MFHINSLFSGFGFVTFVSAEAAEKVLRECPHYLDNKNVSL